MGNVSEFLDSRRIIMLADTVSPKLAADVCARMLAFNAESQEDPIILMLDSPGGSVPAGQSIIDVMRGIAAPVGTIAMGHAMSCAAVILAAGEPGMRYAFPHSSIMIHQIRQMGGGVTTASDMRITFKEMERQHALFVSILVECTGRPAAEIEASLEKDTFFSVREAIDFGLVDHVLEDFEGLCGR